jgi:23S rRNA (cytidine1920-2'-O)/16S rRNA (cytidine1409-2'-O)-methyltransferase
MRLDKILVYRGLFPSRARAQDAITQKTVNVNGVTVDKPSKEIEEEAVIEIIDIFNKYVSRGGLKLEKAIVDFKLDFSYKTVLDVGASTGGFTDCLLQHGAARVVAVDVGSQQLHPSLSTHEKVQSIENRDFRELTPEEVQFQQFDFIVSDVSFISLTCLLPCFSPFLKEEGQLILLIKPQYEAGAAFLSKNGIVRDEKGYKIAIQKVKQEAINWGFYLNALTISTLFEKNRNVEFLACFSKKNNNFTFQYSELFQAIKQQKKAL